MYKIITPVATEPVTLAEVKLHQKITSDTLSGDTVTSQCITPGSHGVAAAYSLVGSSVDVLGKTALVNLNAGSCGIGGSVAAKIQESDDNILWQDFTGGGFTTVTEANDNAVQELSYTGTKRYIRVVVTVAVASCSFSVDVVSLTGEVIEDTLLGDLITTAREWCEKYTGRAFASQTVELILEEFPANAIEIKLPPLQSVTSIKYKDSAGTETTIAATEYIVDTDSDVGKVVLAYGKSWPSFTPYPSNPIRILFIAGYTSIPKSLKQAMLLLIGHWYENREVVVIGAISKEMEFSVKTLLTQYRVRWWD